MKTRPRKRGRSAYSKTVRSQYDSFTTEVHASVVNMFQVMVRVGNVIINQPIYIDQLLNRRRGRVGKGVGHLAHI